MVALLLIGGAIWYLQAQKPDRSAGAFSGSADIVAETASEKTGKYERAKEIVAPAGFVNAEPFELKEIIGKKVILVDFWTYSCINCQRTFPYLNAWYEKYKDKGLEIVGVHTPEFAFEEKIENVRKAVAKFNIAHPVVLDNDYGTWQAYGNQYWPRKYLIDIDGYIVYDHIGEGGYEETERVIQELLVERAVRLGVDLGGVDMNVVRPADAETVDVTMPRSPEIYFGAFRNSRLGNGNAGLLGGQRLEEPANIERDMLYLVGPWNFYEEYAENAAAGAKIVFRYRAEKVFMVASAEGGVRIRILQDGKPVGAAAGSDVGEDGTLNVSDEQLYRLIENPDGYGEHTLEIFIEGPALRAFTFTFG
ncbi:MAG: redoxin family protein [bacterium]|nr:redoxin family protein [bacterium]